MIRVKETIKYPFKDDRNKTYYSYRKCTIDQAISEYNKTGIYRIETVQREFGLVILAGYIHQGWCPEVTIEIKLYNKRKEEIKCIH